MTHFEVVSPAGGESTDKRRVAERLPDLNGKTVAEIWNGVFKGDETFPVIRRALRDKYPGIRVVPYTEFPHFYGGDNPTQQRALAQELAALVKEKGCDAVISGNGA
jgi:hypothetical protein